MDVKVSIIVPVYNVEKYLARCLDSIINQTLNDIEIICVNDGSKDKSSEILEEYARKDKRIIIINQENRGLSGARNKGMEHAKGEFIGFVDSDDYIDLNFYEKLYHEAIKTCSDIACAGIIRENKRKKNIILNFNEVCTADNIKNKCLLVGIPKFNYVWNKLYKTEVLLKSGIQFPERMNYEDCIFSPQVIEYVQKVVTVPDTFYHYWKNVNSIVKTNTDKNRADCIYAQKYLHKFCTKYNLDFYSSKKYLYRKEYFVCGIKVLKVCKMRATTKYLLFGFLPVLVCEERT